MKRLNGSSTLTNAKRSNDIEKSSPCEYASQMANPSQSVPQGKQHKKENSQNQTLDLVVSHASKKVESNQVGVISSEATLSQIELTKNVRSDDFARVFCEWFYSMINCLQPVCSHQPGDTFRESVFCSNSSVDIYLISNTREEKHALGQVNSHALLREVLGQTELLFSPNLSNGIQVHKTEHGMLKIFSCGTLHKVHFFVGIYEQEFGLVFCPVDRAWKIMYTKVNLKHMNVEPEIPSLPPCEVFAIEQG